MNRTAAPVNRSAVQRVEPSGDRRITTLRTVEDTIRADNGAQARAILAMFGGDAQMMQRFLAVTIKALAQQSNLLHDCTPISIVDSIMTAASMGLEPFTDDGAIIPYATVAQFRPMWRGYLKRIRNSGKVVEVDCHVVYENDEFEYAEGTQSYIRHVPARTVKDAEGHIVKDRGGYRGAYAWALMPSGTYIIEVMEEHELNYVRDTWGNRRSDSPWATSWAEMARKTVIRRLAKRLPAAAVDMLLAADKAADDLERKVLQPGESDAVAEARRAAVRAAMGLQSGPPSLPPPEAEPQPEAAKPEPAGTPSGGLFNDAG